MNPSTPGRPIPINDALVNRLLGEQSESVGTIDNLFPVSEGFSGAKVIAVDVGNNELDLQTGFAYAKVDRLTRCRMERIKSGLARRKRNVQPYIPEVIFPQEYDEPITIGDVSYVLYKPAFDSAQTFSLSRVIRFMRNAERGVSLPDVENQIEMLIENVLKAWVVDAGSNRTNIDLADEFVSVLNVGDEDVPKSEKRATTLRDRTQEYFNLKHHPQQLQFNIGDSYTLPNPVYWMTELQHDT